MSVNVLEICHPNYLENIADWQMIRDCAKGSRAVKDAAETYLPRLKGQSNEDYDNYRARALFFPITGKTASTLVGLATANKPKVNAPDAMSSFFDDQVTGYQFSETVATVLMELVLMGRYIILIDAPTTGSLDPKLVPYVAENVVNWDHDDRGNLTMLLLREFRSVAGDKQFERKTITQYRHCFIGDGGYWVRTLNDDLEEVPGTLMQPQFAGRTINYIPVTPFGATGVHINVDKAPMSDIATINISHYLTSADLEWGRHIVGLPTPVVSGVDASTTLRIGGTAAWVLPPAEAKAYYLEFLGQGLQSLEKALQEKIGLMASVSARMVDTSTRGSEAAETVRLRYLSESASLVHLLGAAESGFTLMYNMLAELMGVSGQVIVTLSKEILGAGITFRDMQVLFEAYLNGSISKETLVFNLRRLDAIDPARTDKQEMDAIQDPPPPTPPTPFRPQPALTQG